MSNLSRLHQEKAASENRRFQSTWPLRLARLGKKVGLIDADIYGFSVPDMMGVTEMPVVRGDRIIPVERLRRKSDFNGLLR